MSSSKRLWRQLRSLPHKCFSLTLLSAALYLFCLIAIAVTHTATVPPAVSFSAAVPRLSSSSPPCAIPSDVSFPSYLGAALQSAENILWLSAAAGGGEKQAKESSTSPSPGELMPPLPPLASALHPALSALYRLFPYLADPASLAAMVAAAARTSGSGELEGKSAKTKKIAPIPDPSPAAPAFDTHASCPIWSSPACVLAAVLAYYVSARLLLALLYRARKPSRVPLHTSLATTTGKETTAVTVTRKSDGYASVARLTTAVPLLFLLVDFYTRSHETKNSKNASRVSAVTGRPASVGSSPSSADNAHNYYYYYYYYYSTVPVALACGSSSRVHAERALELLLRAALMVSLAAVVFTEMSSVALAIVGVRPLGAPALALASGRRGKRQNTSHRDSDNKERVEEEEEEEEEGELVECPLCSEVLLVAAASAGKGERPSDKKDTGSSSKGSIASAHVCPVLCAVDTESNNSNNNNISENSQSSDTNINPAAASHSAWPPHAHYSLLSRLTLTWLNPLINATAVSAAALTPPPPSSASPSLPSAGKSGEDAWAAQVRVARRLPPPPRDWDAAKAIDEPAWEIFCEVSAQAAAEASQEKGENPNNNRLSTTTQTNKPSFTAAVSQSRSARTSAAEALLLRLTAPVRGVLLWLFCLVFVPPGGVAEFRRHRGSLMQVFARHPAGREFFYVCVPLKVAQDLLTVAAPSAVRLLILYLNKYGGEGEGEGGAAAASASAPPPTHRPPPTFASVFAEGLILCVWLCVLVTARAVFFQYYLTRLYASAAKATAAIRCLLLRQVMSVPAYKLGGGDEGGKANKSKKSVAAAAGARGASASSSSSSPATAGKQPPPLEGRLVELLTSDAANCGDCLIFLHNSWGHPLVILCALFNLYQYIGAAATAVTFAVLVAMVPLTDRIQAWGKRRWGAGARGGAAAAAASSPASAAAATAQRLGDLSVCFASMRSVKALGLEGDVLARVGRARGAEEASHLTRLFGGALSSAVSECTTLAITLACCGTYLVFSSSSSSSSSSSVDVSVLVPTLAALQTLRFPVWTFPQMRTTAAKGFRSLRRLDDFLFAPVQQQQPPDDVNENRAEDSSATQQTETETATEAAVAAAPSPAVVCRETDFFWTRPAVAATETVKPDAAAAVTPAGATAPVLKNVSLVIQPGEFVLVRGATGSGKSALLQAMLGELCARPAAATAGKAGRTENTTNDSSSACAAAAAAATARVGFAIRGRVAYCPETPWIRNRSIRENITLRARAGGGDETDEAWYQTVLDCCALRRDVAAMAPLGDATLAGEGGSALSGGQRARVGLARALYAMRRQNHHTGTGGGGGVTKGNTNVDARGGATSTSAAAAADVFILDDLLAPLDVDVQKYIIREVFHGAMRYRHYNPSPDASSSPANGCGNTEIDKKTIILCSHLPASMLAPDRVFEVQSDGSVAEVTDAAVAADAKETSSAAVVEELRRKYMEDRQDREVQRQKQTQLQEQAEKETAKNSAKTEPIASSANVTSVQDNGAAADKNDAAQVTTAPTEVKRVPYGNNTAVYFLARRAGLPLPVASLLSYSPTRFSSSLLAAALLALTTVSLHTIVDNWIGIFVSLQGYFERRSGGRIDATMQNPSARFESASGRRHHPQHFTGTPHLGVGGGSGSGSSGAAVTAAFLSSYALLGVLAAAAAMLHACHYNAVYSRLAGALHDRCLGALLAAPPSFFDRTPSGGLVSLFSSEQRVVDQLLGESLQLIVVTGLQLLSVVAFNALQYPAFVAVVPASLLLLAHLTRRFLRLAKVARGLEGRLQGRALALLSEAARGATTIRAFDRCAGGGSEGDPQPQHRQQEVSREHGGGEDESASGGARPPAPGPVAGMLLGEVCEALDAAHAATHVGISGDRWIGLRLEVVSLLMTLSLATTAVVWTAVAAARRPYASGGLASSSSSSSSSASAPAGQGTGAALAGLGVMACMGVSRSLALLCRRAGMFQSQLVSAERQMDAIASTTAEPGADAYLALAAGDSSATQQRRRHGHHSQDEEEEDDWEESGNEKDSAALPVLRVRGLRARYQPSLPEVLRGVAFALAAGEGVGIIGRTGNGKSTIFNALLQLMDVVEGTIAVRGGGSLRQQQRRQQQQTGRQTQKYQVDEFGKGKDADDADGLPDGMVDVLDKNDPRGAWRRFWCRRHYFHLLPQEPLLLRGTVRENLLLGLDAAAAASASDATLSAALARVGLDTLLTGGSDAVDGGRESKVNNNSETNSGDGGSKTDAIKSENASQANGESTGGKTAADAVLAYTVEAGGANLSAGQRQLLCLARALLHRPRVLLLDEVSSRVDAATDERIRRVIKEDFLSQSTSATAPPRPTDDVDGNNARRKGGACGLLLIAHRLETVMALCSRVVVVGGGGGSGSGSGEGSNGKDNSAGSGSSAQQTRVIDVSELHGIDDLASYL